MPVHRLAWDAEQSVWFEWGVTAFDGRLQWTRLTGKQSELRLQNLGPKTKPEGQTPFSLMAHRWPAELLRALPDGFVLEVCPEADRWWAQAAAIFETGKLLTLDYGFSEQDQIAPERAGGTLRSYYRHQPSTDVLANPGQQDITAHVDFSTLRAVGEQAGLKTDALVTQERFLTRVASRALDEKLSFGPWTAERKRQFRTLTHPNHLGHAFRVLVQSR